MDTNLRSFYYNRLNQIFFYITYECNFSCKHCLVGDRFNLAHFSQTEVFGILETIKSAGGRKVTLLGGEPTLHANFCEIVDFAKEQGYYIVLDTNGSFPEHYWEDERFIKIDTFCFSVDGHNEKIHEMVRNKGSFEDILRQIAHAKNREKKIKFTHTVTKSNVDSVLEMINFARELKIDELNIHVATYNGRAKLVDDPEIISPEEWHSQYRRIKKFIAGETLETLELRIPPRYCTHEELLSEFSDHLCIGQVADRMLILPEAKSKGDIGGPLYVCGLLIGEQYKIGWYINGNFICAQDNISEFHNYYITVPKIANIPICPIISREIKNLNYLPDKGYIPLCISYKPPLLSRSS